MSHVTFLIFIFNSVQLSYWKDKVLSSQGKKQNEASSSGSNFRKLYVKKALLGEKNRALLCALLQNRKCIR
jgi:hypothetical protein